MAMRRPRIKAAALLTTKRKSRDVKSENGIKPAIVECSGEINAKPANPQVQNVANVQNTTDDNSKDKVAEIISSEHIENKHNDDATEQNSKCVNTSTEQKSSDKITENGESNEGFQDKVKNKLEESSSSFKCPARVEYIRNNNQPSGNAGTDDVFYSDMEESILQSDMQKSASDCAALPSKQQGRQRIRPVPTFPRRNSFVGIGSPSQNSLDDGIVPVDIPIDHSKLTMVGESSETSNSQKVQPLTHRRERHYSASMVQSPHTPNSVISQHHYAPHKFTPAMGLSRIRTESNCSAFSDSFVTPTKLRKTDEHSTRTNSRRDVSLRIVNGNLDKSSLKMFDLIYYNPVTNPMEKRNTISTIKKEPTIDENDTKLADSKVEVGDEANNAMPVPQLKLNANGDLILDEKTLEIETTAEQEARKVLANSSLIFLDENTGMNGFYKRQKRTKDWPPEETIKFYRCLQTVGTDFSLMCQLFPKRTRRDLKLKFKKEERNNLALINKALLYPKLFNIDDLKTQLETEEREREEAIQRWKEIHEKEAKTIKKVKINSSTAARALKNGDDIYENENVVKRKISRRSNATDKQKTDSAKKSKTSQTQQTLSVSNGTEAVPQQKQKLKAKHGVLHNNSEEILSSQAQGIPLPLPTQSNDVTPVKLEIVHAQNYTIKAEHPINESNCFNTEMPSTNVEKNLEMMSSLDAMAEEFINIIAPTSCDASQSLNEIVTPTKESCSQSSVAEVENKTFFDLVNGTVNTVNSLQGADESLAVMDVMPATPSSISQREVDECDIQQILMDLADGSLVLVSTLDPDNADQVVNEIYMMDKVTGELCEKPLDIPESIVQCVLSVMN
ncbi:transcription factor TFIIIB component B'' homolog [Bactrocera neohumeralis]|uniref:transcription factor TFIIIB component B'' homolog n=1 Tax=Bactrocera tryoni TaxID=59916 RepID=UPI001A964564|nr:transcription factor TFIIIB component B'' homolog [Bactrocera tryoni]XP_050319172.1 transcription factor TFIIIB component B'' homolog [Bactrocera neohumeralis]